MAEVVWTDEALGWLREIHDYIAEENPAAATRVIDGAMDVTRYLE